MGRKVCSHTLILILVLLILPAWAFAAQGTIVLKSGERLENVNYAIDNVYKVLKIGDGVTTRNISFGDVATVLDSRGEDVTNRVVGGTRTQPDAPSVSPSTGWVSKQDAAYKAENRTAYAFELCTGPDFTLATGDYYKGFTAGVGYKFEAVLPVSRVFALRAHISRAGIGVSDDLGGYAPVSVYRPIRSDLKVAVWRYFLSGQYYRSLSESKDIGHWYAYSGLGAVTTKLDGTILYDVVDSDEQMMLAWDVSDTHVAMTLGVGFTRRISGMLYADGRVSGDMLYVSGKNSNGESAIAYAYLFDIRLGLSIIFPHSQPNNQEE